MPPWHVPLPERDAVIERSGTAHGFDWEVWATDMGHRCGYVRIPEGHKIHGVRYDDVIPGFSKEKNLAEMQVGKRGPLDLFIMASSEGDDVQLGWLIDVHGSVTFTGQRSSPGWWIGFDCAHHGDGKDLNLIEDPKLREIYADDDSGEARSADYVESECISLARQIKELFP